MYNETVLERDKLQAISRANNPSVRDINAKLVDLESMKRSLNSYVKQLQVSVNELQNGTKSTRSLMYVFKQKENYCVSLSVSKN